MLVDVAAGQRLVRSDWQGFNRWYVPGLALLQVGGSLLEGTSSAAAGLLMALLLNQAVSRYLSVRAGAARRKPIGTGRDSSSLGGLT